VIVAVVSVRMVEVARDEVVHVVAMPNRCVTTVRPVAVGGVMTATVVFRGAAVRIPVTHADSVLVDMILMSLVLHSAFQARVDLRRCELGA
jgi:hypothetical protein